MLLRRITQHVKDQNWFAVGLDFVIVVVGIWVALMVGQWSDQRQTRVSLAQAEQAIHSEIAAAYYYSYERLSIAPCRKARYAELAEMLLDSDTKWPGSPGPYGDGLLTKHRVLPPALRSSRRFWESQAWDIALAKGTLDILEEEKRSKLAIHFGEVKSAAAIQEEIFRIEARLQVLTYPLQMTMSDRLRYYDVLAEADAISADLELSAELIINGIEEGPLLTFTGQLEEDMRAFIAAQDAYPYGDCRTPIVLPLLDPEQHQAEEIE